MRHFQFSHLTGVLTLLALQDAELVAIAIAAGGLELGLEFILLRLQLGTLFVVIFVFRSVGNLLDDRLCWRLDRAREDAVQRIVILGCLL